MDGSVSAVGGGCRRHRRSGARACFANRPSCASPPILSWTTSWPRCVTIRQNSLIISRNLRRGAVRRSRLSRRRVSQVSIFVLSVCTSPEHEERSARRLPVPSGKQALRRNEKEAGGKASQALSTLTAALLLNRGLLCVPRRGTAGQGVDVGRAESTTFVLRRLIKNQSNPLGSLTSTGLSSRRRAVPGRR